MIEESATSNVCPPAGLDFALAAALAKLPDHAVVRTRAVGHGGELEESVVRTSREALPAKFDERAIKDEKRSSIRLGSQVETVQAERGEELSMRDWFTELLHVDSPDA
jgi:hypothetical protein